MMTKVILWNTTVVLKGLTDSDDTVEYQDLVINDDESWSLLTEEQKLCSNTGSFSVPRYIDNSPVDVTGVRSSNSYETSTMDIPWSKQCAQELFRYYGTLMNI